MSNSPMDLELMRRAIDLARPNRTHPNPRVGAVVVAPDGTVVGEGAHPGAGLPHAEALALAAAGDAAAGATLYVTLEPCGHHGRTPPCTETVVASGVRRVVVGVTDPDPRVAGAGLARLRATGLEVTVGVLEAEVEALDPAYFHHRRTGLPLVTLKAAITLDGQAAAQDGTSQWITGPEARADAHRLRAEADALMVGAGTLRVDDPLLTVRLDGYEGPQPVPVVVAGRRPLPASARALRPEAIVLAPEGDGLVDLREGLRSLADRGLLDVLVEGGPRLAASVWQAGLVRRGVWYVGANVAGGVGMGAFAAAFPTLEAARRARILEVRRLGGDLRIDWEPEER